MKILKFTLVLLVALVMFELLARIIGFRPLFSFQMNSYPNSYIEKSALLGWKNRPGDYKIFVNSKSKSFVATINEENNRISKESNLLNQPNIEKTLHIYGCSVTFGLSVENNQTQSYQLQKILPNVDVINKGVPGYGLTQMYLHLKEDLSKNNLPDIVVINYSDFHDIRTNECKYWGSMIRHALVKGEKDLVNTIDLPAYQLSDTNKLNLVYTPFRDLNKHIYLSDKFVSIGTVNNLINNHSDSRKTDYFQEVSKRIIEYIISLCLQNDVVPIIAYLINSNDMEPTYKVINTAKSLNCKTLVYSIDFGKEGYNNTPNDNGHPNAKAHFIFANELKTFLVQNNLVEETAIQETKTIKSQ